MSDERPAPGADDPRSLECVLEDVCDRVEAVWKKGGRPDLEEALGKVPEAARPALFRSLLVLELAYLRGRGERPTAEEYRRRFPAHSAAIEAVFGVTQSTPRVDTDHTLLYAILALQNELIDRDILLAAFKAWVVNKSRPLGQVLLERGAVTAETHAMLEALARTFLQTHGGKLEESLAALSSLGSIREDLEALGDTDLHATLSRVPKGEGRVGSDDAGPRGREGGPQPAARASGSSGSTRPAGSGWSTSPTTRSCIARWP